MTDEPDNFATDAYYKCGKTGRRVRQILSNHRRRRTDKQLKKDSEYSVETF